MLADRINYLRLVSMIWRHERERRAYMNMILLDMEDKIELKRLM